MWHALRAELAYFRPWLLGALAIAAGVAILISIIFSLVDDGPANAVASALRIFFPLIAGMVVGFIAQAHLSEEGRARLLMTGPMTPQQVGAVVVLVPALLYFLGALVGAAVLGTEYLITGRLEVETLRIVSGVAGMLFGAGQMGTLAQESSAAHRQTRSRAAMLGWGSFSIAVLLLSASQFGLGRVVANLGQGLIGLFAISASWLLYRGRTDFTG